ncbi:glycosyl transferase [Rubrobacter xylanophilus]|uniref:Glycosyl transferase n=1 Tax=Rubrobacter xylanophilus TaxID=49319 RepID=A0A510HLG9_9ACTN|nr:glycosyl transferase [Rubrobacter xylanophilus]BBL80648.1 glycosyl transferase [Rubrobacter xylanophilus]
MIEALVGGGVAFLVAGAMAPLLVRFAAGRNLLDVPNARSSHEVPTPRLGGVGVVFGAWAGALLLDLRGVWPLLAAATLVALVGLADDLSGLHFGAKAAVQAVVASGLLLLYPPAVLSEMGGVLWPAVFVAGVLWLCAVCNAYNFMDGIDGMTGGVAVTNALFLLALAGDAGAFLPALAGAALGFLVWNIGPASIFMGDAGSYFLGFSLAATALYTPDGGEVRAFLACALVFAPYLFDTSYTIVRRLRRGVGKGIFSAHREHIYQRITPSTGMHRRTSNLYYGAAVVSGIAALAAARGWVVPGLGLALGCCLLLAALPRLVRSR